MEKGCGITSINGKCFFCGKSTNEYDTYYQNGIKIYVYAHTDCRKDLSESAKISFMIFKKDKA